MNQSKFSIPIIFTLLSLFTISFVLSLFLLQFCGGLIFIIWLLEKWNEKKNMFDIIFLSIFLFGFIRLLSIIFSEFPSSSIESLYKEALFYVVLVSLPFYLKTLDKGKLLKLVQIFILGAVAMSLVGITRFFIGDVNRAEAISSSYTVFSAYLMVALGMTLYFPGGMQRKLSLLYKPLTVFILFSGIVASLGRINIAIAVLMFISAIIFKRINPKQLIVLGMLFSVFGLLYLNHRTELISERVTNITQLSDRDIIWKGAVHLVYKHPLLGFGPRTFKDIFPFTKQFKDRGIGGWHNDFLQIYFESGLLGLLTFILLLIVTIGISINQIMNKKIDTDFRSLSVSVLVSVSGLILSSLTAGFITSVVLSILFAFLLSLLSRIEGEGKISLKEKSFILICKSLKIQLPK